MTKYKLIIKFRKFQIVHRDIAARNILLAKNWTAKISDLGLSKTLEQVDNHYQNESNYYVSVSFIVFQVCLDWILIILCFSGAVKKFRSDGSHWRHWIRENFRRTRTFGRLGSCSGNSSTGVNFSRTMTSRTMRTSCRISSRS